MRFFLNLFLLTWTILLLESPAWAKKNNRAYRVISQTLENNRTQYKVLEIDKDLISEQNRISQRVIYEKIGLQGQEKIILNEALSKLKQSPLSVQTSLSRDELEHLSRPSREALWTPIKPSWSLEDEKDYSQWITQNVNVDFNRGSNLFADCADVGLLLRWAYAHDKKLPIANTLSGSGKLFGHFTGSASWDHLPTHSDWKKDERFKAALRYLFDNSYTHSIYNDLYPTEINKTYIHPGSVYMIIRQKSGHTQTLFQLDQESSGIRTLWGNEPSGDEIFESWIIWETAIKNMFGSWRWPIYDKGQWKLILGEKMPGYSKIQFQKREEFNDEDAFEIWVLSQLELVDYDLGRLTRQIEVMSEALDFRLNITAVGATICGGSSCDPNGPDYDFYSTSSRDSRLKQAQKKLFKIINKLGGEQAQIVQEAIKNTRISRILIDGFDLSYKDYILSKSTLNEIKPEASLSFLERWGLKTFPNSKVQFAFLNQQLQYAIEERRYFFELANYNCFQNQCNPQEEFIKRLDTSKIDSGLAKIGQKLNELQNSPELNQEVDFLNQIKNPYRYRLLSFWYPQSVISEQCEIINNCTLFDVLWRTDSLNKITQWKPFPKDDLRLRWGL